MSLVNCLSACLIQPREFLYEATIVRNVSIGGPIVDLLKLHVDFLVYHQDWHTKNRFVTKTALGWKINQKQRFDGFNQCILMIFNPEWGKNNEFRHYLAAKLYREKFSL